jgi:hypothetical protein
MVGVQEPQKYIDPETEKLSRPISTCRRHLFWDIAIVQATISAYSTEEQDGDVDTVNVRMMLLFR